MENPGPYRRLLPAEEALLLISARRRIPDELLTAATNLIPGVDWDGFLRLTLEHGVGPLVYASMKRHFPSVIPAPCLAELRQTALANAQNNLALLRELLSIAQQLEANGIRYAIFKGLIINQMVYQDMGIRRCGDIDLLVGKRDFPRAKDWFISQGFHQTMSENAEIRCLQSGLWHEQRRLKLDLHWGIPPHELGIRADRILGRVSGISISGRSLPTFAPEDMLIVLCVNACKEYWNQRLYPYCDIHEFLLDHRELDWTSIFRRARELKCERMLQTALGMVHELYETGLPPLSGEYARTGSQPRLVVEELLQQLFEREISDTAWAGQDRHLYFFHSPDDYFIALMDTRRRRAAHRYIHRHINRAISITNELDQTASDATPSFLDPAIRPLRIAALLLRRLYRKLTGGSQSGR